MRPPRRIVAVLAALTALLLAPASALAHAQLLGTVPPRDSMVPTQPADVIFEFNQAVRGTLGAVRVYDAKGAEVDNSDVGHPNGQQSWMGVGLKPDLPHGTYVATYRVISADTHVVYGGNVFSIGAPGAGPALSVQQLISRSRAGHVTAVSFAVVKGLDYVSIALMIGALAFLAWVWLPELAEQAGPESRWAVASRAFARRIVQLLALAIVLGVVAGVLGIILQGATEAGVSFWKALNGHIINTVLDSRFGWVWGSRLIVWLLFGGMLVALSLLRRGAVPVLRPVPLGADGIALLPPSPWLVGAAAVAAAYLTITPALSGHASVESPRGLLFPLDVLHVASMGVWLGGLVCLVVAVPAATRQLQPAERTRLLAGALVRFSPVALACVLTLLLTGVVQGYIHIRSWDGLFDTTYGVAVLIKFALLMALVALGALNRQRTIPALSRAVATHRSPGEIGVLLRRTLRAEVLLVIVVLGVTSALVGYAPPVDATQGPFSGTAPIGPAQLQMTVDPARVGLNTIHLYLINPKDGSQFTATQELDVQASLPAKGIGPLQLTATPAGPGHYIVNSTQLIPGGTWDIQVTDRVSSFDEYLQTVKVPIR